MKKSLLFSGLIVAVTLLCCYALVTADVIHQKRVATTHSVLQTKAPAAATIQKVDQAAVSDPKAGLLSGATKTAALPVPKAEKLDKSPIATWPGSVVMKAISPAKETEETEAAEIAKKLELMKETEAAKTAKHLELLRAKTAPKGQKAIQPTMRHLDTNLLTEGFESAVVPPAGWTAIVNNPYTWEIDSYSPYEGVYNATCYYDETYSGTQDEWLVSPVIDLTTRTDWTVHFAWQGSYYWAVDPYDNYDLNLRISLDGGATWEATILWNEDNEGVFTNWTWYVEDISLAAYSTYNNVKLGFQYYGYDGAQFSIDAIVVDDAGGPGPQYCAASGGNDEYISRVQCGEIDNPTGWVSPGYSNYTAMCATMQVGIGTAITVTIGNPYSSDMGGLYVDWNNDLDFYDLGEELYDEVTWTGVGPYVGTIIPPAGASGNYRMRVRLQYTGVTDPCGATTYGEVEDYCINVGGAEPRGACCDEVTGNCVDDVLFSECAGRFVANTLCADLDPPCVPEPPGNNCSNPIIVNLPPVVLDWPYTDNNTTCGRGNDYSSTCLGSYDGGQDIIYQLNVSSAVTVILSLTSDATWVGMLVDDACPPDPTTCLYMCSSSGSGCTINNANLAIGTYYIMIDTWPSPDCIANFTLTIDQSGGPQPGDECADAIVIPSLPYTDTKNTCLYTNTCANASEDLFYKYTVQSPDEYLTISLCGSSFDTYLWVWSECCVTLLASNDDYCGVQSQIDRCFDPGDIWIQVEGYDGAGVCGTAILTVTSLGPCPEAPENDDCADATAVTLPWEGDGTTLGATDDCAALAGYPSVWYSFDLPYDCNNLTVEFCNSPMIFNNYLIVLSVDCECSMFYYGAYGWTCADGNLINRFNGLPAGTYYLPIYVDPPGPFHLYIHNEECQPGPECPEGSLFAQGPTDAAGAWNAYTSDNNTAGFNYTVFDNFWGLTAYVCDIHFWGLNLYWGPGWYDCPGENPMTFDIAFYQDAAGMPGAQVAAFTIPVTGVNTGIYYAGYPMYYYSTTLSPCVGLPAGWVSIQGVSTGSPDCAFLWMNSPYGDLNAYQYDGAVMGQLYDDLAFCLTGEGALIGACCDPFTGNCADNVPAGDCPSPSIFYANTACVDIQPPCGMGACCDNVTGECTQTTYANCSGTWHAGLSCDPNPCPPLGDECTTAIVIPSLPYTDTQNTCSFTNTCGNASADVFYKYTVQSPNEYLTISLCGSDFDTYLWVWSECCVTLLASNDDYCGLQSQIDRCFMPGDIWIQVEGYSSACGNALLNVTSVPCPEAPPNDLCNDAITLIVNDPNPTCASNIGATGPDCPEYGFPDLWYTFTLTEECGDLVIEWCGTTLSGSLYPYLYDDCNCTNPMWCTSYEWDTCPDGLISLHWTPLPAGTYYYPFNTDGVGDFCIRAACAGAPNCMPCEAAIPMSGFVYDHSFSTCDWNGMPQTCLVGCHPYELACAGSQYLAGPKIFYMMNLACQTTVDILCTPSPTMDPQLMVFTVCPTIGGDEDCMSCVASSDSGSSPWDGMPERIVTTIGPGVYYLSVDCYQNAGTFSCGTYDLHVTSSDCPLPVELTTLEAIAGDREVALRWTTASERDNASFDVQRKTVSSEWTTVGQVNGAGNSQTPTNYSYTDRAVVNGVAYTYRLISRDINGTTHEFETTVEATPGAPLPTEYALNQNYPNPFNPHTSITYAVKEAGFVTLKVYNLLGQEVANLVSAKMEAGRYTAAFTANDLPSGVYVYRLEVNDFTAQKKMVLLK